MVKTYSDVHRLITVLYLLSTIHNIWMIFMRQHYLHETRELVACPMS